MQAKKSHKYADLDAAILNAIKEGANTFSLIGVHRVVAAEVKKVRDDDGLNRWAMKPEFRYIDGRLQALRKAGKIQAKRHFNTLIWVPVEAA